MDCHGGEILEPVDVANTFCGYFSTVIANRLDADIPLTNTDPMYYMPDPEPASFSPPSATIIEVQKIIAAFPNKPSKINVLPVFAFKKLSYIIAPVICDIFNTSKNQGIFPSNLKLSRTVPIHKAKSHKLTNNFRPISLLPLMSK